MRTVLTRGRYQFTVPDRPDDAALVELEPPGASAAAPPAPVIAPNRKQRRRNKSFNKKLGARLQKDNVPAEVEVLPDGGIKVTVDAREK